MSNGVALQIFNFKDVVVRAVMVDGHSWFVAQDVCQCLDLKNTSQTLNALDEDEKGIQPVDTPGGPQQMLAVNEPGVYSLAILSRKPAAREFKRWLVHEVLPALRSKGFYFMGAGGKLPTQAELTHSIAGEVVKHEVALAAQEKQLGEHGELLGKLSYRESAQRISLHELGDRMMRVEAEVYPDPPSATKDFDGVISPKTAREMALSFGVYTQREQPHTFFVTWLLGDVLNLIGNPEYGLWRYGSSGNKKGWKFFEGAIKKFLEKKWGPNPWNWPNARIIEQDSSGKIIKKERWLTRFAARPVTTPAAGTRSERFIETYLVSQHEVKVTRLAQGLSVKLIRYVGDAPHLNVVPSSRVSMTDPPGFLVWASHAHHAIQAVVDHLHKTDTADIVQDFCVLYNWNRVTGKPYPVPKTIPGVH